METRSNHVLVGAVALVLFVALFGFILWIARFDTGDTTEYDVFFESVSGLATGSAVNYSGVPVGNVKEIAILPDSPEFIRVRINVDNETPILQGTKATLSSVGFTGVAIVSLDGATMGAPRITELGPYGAPVIPTQPGTFDSLLNAAPQLLEEVQGLTEKLGQMLSEDNQNSIAAILENSARITGALASREGDIQQSIVEARATVENMRQAADSLNRIMGKTEALVDEDGRPMLAQLQATLASAETALAEVEQAAKGTNAAVGVVTQQTLPEVNLLVRDLRRTSSSLGAIAAKLDEDPAGALVGGRTLPTYTPGDEE